MRGDVPSSSRNGSNVCSFSPRARGCSALVVTNDVAEEVFPACAGMFPPTLQLSWHRACFPRVRGDVPQTRAPNATPNPFSPRARGCSGAGFASVPSRCVFPACAGMFLELAKWSRPRNCFPRVRGDVPIRNARRDIDTKFSPRARGCSSFLQAFNPAVPVFPACAGMFPKPFRDGQRDLGFPRVRGDVPKTLRLSTKR